MCRDGIGQRVAVDVHPCERRTERHVFIGCLTRVRCHGNIIDRRDGDRDGRWSRVDGAVVGSEREGVHPIVISVWRVGVSASRRVIDDHRAVCWLCCHSIGQRVSIDVRRSERGAERHIFVRHLARVCRHGSVVDRRHGDADRRWLSIRGAVVHREREGVHPIVISVWRVGVSASRRVIEHDHTVCRLCRDGIGQRVAVDVHPCERRTERHVFIGCLTRVRCHGNIIDRRDGDRDGRWSRVDGAVVGSEREGVHPIVISVWRVGVSASRRVIEHDHTVCRLCRDGIGQRVAVDVHPCERRTERHVFIGCLTRVRCHGNIIDRRDGDRDGRWSRVDGAVVGSEREGVHPIVISVWRVGVSASRRVIDDHRAVCWLCCHSIGQRVAVDVRPGQQGAERRVFVGGFGRAICHRGIIEWRDGDADGGCVGVEGAIAHRESERVHPVVIGGRRVGVCARARVVENQHAIGRLRCDRVGQRVAVNVIALKV